MRLKCYMDVDGVNDVVTLRGLHGETYAKFRLEAGTSGTFTRLQPGYDADNYWIALKPADSAVFGGGLFDERKKLIVHELHFAMEKK